MVMNSSKCMAVGLSGGVDSSVALYLLKQSYDHLIGASHDICEDSLSCNDETLSRAARLAERFGIPYYRFDMRELFSHEVIDDFAAEYLAGRTPNPCVRCNERIRFTAFFDACSRRAAAEGLCSDAADVRFATGHYARRGSFEGYPVIQRGKDTKKDQSYMLYRIPSDHLERIEFPLGEYTKEEIVRIAVREGFPSSSVKESQDICFIPGRYTDRLIELLGSERVCRKGSIIDEQGSLLGDHRGYMHYTIGQRQGLGLNDGPWYVKRLDPVNNTVIVGRKDQLLSSSFTLEDENWFVPMELISDLSSDRTLRVRIRYNSAERPAQLEQRSGRLSVHLTEGASVTPGQSAVFYHGDSVLGGGSIGSVC